jgi:hypothetical protein
LYSFGSNICGQLGQFVSDYEKKRRDSFEEINFQKLANSLDKSYSFMSNFDSQSNSEFNQSPRGQETEFKMDASYNRDESNNVDMGNNNAPLMSPPALLSAQDYGLETVSHTPKMIKSLMHRKVIKISSGGVHNICIVE